MEPMLFCLLVACYLVRNTTQDLVFKATGQLPPSYRREEARREAREKRAAERRAKGDGPIKRFLMRELEEALIDAEARRKRARDKKRAKRELEWAEEDAHEENAHRPPLEESEPQEPELLQCGQCGVSLTRDQIAGYNMSADPLCAICRHSRTGDRPSPDLPPWPWKEDPPASEQSPQQPTVPPATPHPRSPDSPDTTEAPRPAPAGDPAPAEVIDIATWRRPGAIPKPIKEDDMTTTATSGETTNLAAALNYTTEMANQCAMGAASVETSIATLRAGGVTGPVLADLMAAQELLSQAMSKFTSANAHLTQQLVVKEAYQATPDAGEKQFVVQD